MHVILRAHVLLCCHRSTPCCASHSLPWPLPLQRGGESAPRGWRPNQGRLARSYVAEYHVWAMSCAPWSIASALGQRPAPIPLVVAATADATVYKLGRPGLDDEQVSTLHASANARAAGLARPSRPRLLTGVCW